jgi:polysaccharide biosynthesis/export protein
MQALESTATMYRLSGVLILLFLGFLGHFQFGLAQDSSLQQGAPAPSARVNNNSNQGPVETASQTQTPSPLVIGPGDELEITVYGAPDLSEHTRVSAGGSISIPLVGSVHVGGLTSSEAEGAIENQLRQNRILNDPQVSLFVKEYTSSGISVAGEVAKPGFYSVLGPHHLLDVLEAAGGPTERASNRVVVTHRGEKDSTTYTLSNDPAEMTVNNVDLHPGDTVIVPRAGVVYVLGEVNKPGGYVMNSSGGVTVLQLVAVAGGTTRVASAGKTRLLRKTDTGFQEQQIDLKKLLRGHIKDVAVSNQDILYVPTSGVKRALDASALVAVAAGTAIWRVPY